MKVKTAELKAFKNNASHIKTKGIIPILSFLKIENGEITKTGLESFVVQKIDCKGSVLLNETILYDFLNRTRENVMEITVKDKRVTLSDGVLPKVSFSEEDITVFPKIQEAESDPIDLDNDVFCAINFATNFTDHMDLPDMRGHVFLGKGIVFGSNGLIGYMEKIKATLPEVAILKDFATVIGKFVTASFSESEKYIFFETNECKYGFIKSMYPFADMSTVIKLDTKSSSFMLDKSELLNFSEMCVSSSKAPLKIANMAVKQNKLCMDMVDIDYEVNVNHAVPIGNGEMEGEFAFNPVMMTTMLKNLPDEELTFYRNNGSLIITGDTGFTSIIQQLQNKN